MLYTGTGIDNPRLTVFDTEHTHIPASRETPYPAGGELPREYWRIYDPCPIGGPPTPPPG